MSIGKTLVSHCRLIKPFGDAGALVAKSRDAAVKAAGSAGEADRMLAGLSGGLAALRDDEHNAQVMATARHPAAALLQSYVARQARAAGRLERLHLGGDFPFDGFEVKFSDHDWLGWAESFFAWWRGLKRHQFPPADPAPAPIPNRFRIAVLGDWGTGLYGAPFCAQTIENDPDPCEMLLHLGDVYYSGTEDEVEERFLAFWPNRPDAMSRALNGNHEMYTGGYGYFDTILPRLNQKASYFALQNDCWLLVGLDSAYQDGDLNQEQVDWLGPILQGAGERKVVLFTHHQPYSLLDEQGPKLIARLRAHLDAQRIYAWYWGHEHRCVVYGPHPVWGLLGRCIGHSGFPNPRDEVSRAPGVPGLYDGWRRLDGTRLDDGTVVPGALVLDSPNVYIAGFEEQFGPHGYLRLDFDGPQLREIIRAPQGADLFDALVK